MTSERPWIPERRDGYSWEPGYYVYEVGDLVTRTVNYNERGAPLSKPLIGTVLSVDGRYAVVQFKGRKTRHNLTMAQLKPCAK